MIGIDIVDVSRIEKVMGDTFYRRVFTPTECLYVESRKYSPQTVAGLFAAKEAVLKALGTGVGNGASFLQIEISHTALGQPQVSLSGKTAEVLATLGDRICLSISHTDTTAIAIAQIYGSKNSENI